MLPLVFIFSSDYPTLLSCYNYFELYVYQQDNDSKGNIKVNKDIF